MKMKKGTNMRKLILIVLFLTAGFVLAGCASHTVVPKPSEITFEQAMEQVANGLNKMYDIGKDKPKTGLTPAEVTIEFNISASGSDKGKLFIDAGANTLDTLQVVKAGAEASSEIQASRGNKITIKFTNLFLSDSKDSLIMIKTPEEIAALLDTLKAHGYDIVIRKQDDTKNIPAAK
jgi:hypothetical protein